MFEFLCAFVCVCPCAGVHVHVCVCVCVCLCGSCVMYVLTIVCACVHDVLVYS